MKKYKLKEEAKDQIKMTLMIILIICTFVVFAFGFAFLPFVLFNWIPFNKIGNFEIYCSYIGIVSWTIVLSFLAIEFKKWLSKNIIEVEE